MTDEQKREHAEAIKHALGMGYGPPMEGEEGWVDPRQKALDRMAENARELGLTYEPADDQLVAMYVEGDAIDRWLVPDDRTPQEKAQSVRAWMGAAMTVEDADDESPADLADELERTAEERAENAQAVIEAIREAKERRMAEELAKQRAKAAEPKPSTAPWAVIGKAEDDGERLMKKIRDFGGCQ